MRTRMKIQTKRIAAALLSVMIAVNCAGCSAATDILDDFADRFGIELPSFLKNTENALAFPTVLLKRW